MWRVLHDPIVAPGPSRAKRELLDAARSRARIVEGLRGEYDSELVQQILERRASVSQLWKFETVAVYVLDHSLIGRNNQLPQIPQFGRFAAEELNHFMRIVNRSCVYHH